MASLLTLGDCLEVLDTLKNNSVKLTITSPPYDDLRTYEDSLRWDFGVFKKVADKLFRVTEEGGVVVWVVGDATVKGTETGSSFRQALYFKDIGFNIHDTMIYHKDNPPPIGGYNRYYSSFEYMFVFSKGKPSTFNPIIKPRRNKHNDKRTERMKKMTRDKDGSFTIKKVKINENVKIQNVWTYTVSGGASTKDKEAHKHPAIFPEKLAEDHITSWSNEGDMVLDPFMGSGTTGKMATLLNRDYTGIEKVKEYFKIAERRIANVENMNPLF